MIIEFSDDDILQSKVVEPAWYRVYITDVEDRVNKNGDGTNTWLKGKILFNADTGSKENAGVPTPFLWLFSSKAPFAAVGFAVAMGVEMKAKARFNMMGVKGKQIDVFIENEMYNGVMQNKINHKYRAVRPDSIVPEEEVSSLVQQETQKDADGNDIPF